jgi:glycosyltransferase involved in cell wall biosynthesis/GT2 family glycosyltransferase
MRYIQVLDALDFGDAVSNQVINLHHMLLMRGEDSQIFSKYANHRVQHYRQPFESLEVREDVILIHHFSGYSEIAEDVIQFRCYKIFAYHNITPHTFFEKGTLLYNFCRKGRSQLQKILPRYDFSIGDSLYNCRELESLGFKRCRELPIAIPFPRNLAIPSGSVICQNQTEEKKWLFLGRIAPNKRQDLIVEVFAYHAKLYPHEKHHLYLVGRYEEEDPFYQKIASKIKALNLENQITLSGKVEDELLPGYYQSADVFVCLSQHEGFCVPIVEAFNYQLPVVAYASTAIETTLGNSYGALKELDIELAAQRIHEVLSCTTLQDELKQHGLQQATRFSFEVVQQCLYSILDEDIFAGSDRLITVSVIIFTCDHREALERCLAYLMDQDYPHFEVIVVHGPSINDTMSVLNDRLNIKIVQSPTTNLAISRNLGIEQASGEIVAFIYDDALPYTNWLTEIVRRYHELPPTIVGIGGRTLSSDQLIFEFEEGTVDAFGNIINLEQAKITPHASDRYRYLSTTNATFRREALISAQGFDERNNDSMAEIDLAVRLQQSGGLLFTAPTAYVRHDSGQRAHSLEIDRSFNDRLDDKITTQNHVYFSMKNAPQDSSLFKRIAIVWTQLRRQCSNLHEETVLRNITSRSRIFLGGAIGYYESLSKRKLRPLMSQPATTFVSYLNPPTETNSQDDCSSQAEETSVLPSPKRLHILLVSQEFPPHTLGEIGTYNHTLARELIQFGHEVTVISRGKQNLTETITETVGAFTQIQVTIVKDEEALPKYPILSKKLAWARTVRKIVEKVHLQRPISVIESASWDLETIDILKHRHTLTIPLVTRLVPPLKVAIDMNGWTINPDLKACIELEKILVDQTDTVVPDPSPTAIPLRHKLSQGGNRCGEVLSSRNMAKSSLTLYQSLVDRMRTNSTTMTGNDSHSFQHSILDEFEQIASCREIQEEDLLRKMDLKSHLDSHLDDRLAVTNPSQEKPSMTRHSDWDIVRPRMIGWGIFNPMINRFVVPKIAKFINSVLHPSMQMQSALNSTLLSENIQLRNELDRMNEQLSQLTKSMQQLALLQEGISSKASQIVCNPKEEFIDNPNPHPPSNHPL